MTDPDKNTATTGGQAPRGGRRSPHVRHGIGAFSGARHDDTRRLEAFSDGVFAIAITLLVLNFDIPSGLGSSEVWPSIAAQSDQFISAAISFAVIGVYWAGHHTTFTRIDHGSAALTVVNLVLLAAIVFMPFATLVLAEYSNTFAGVALYAATLSVAGYAATGLMWLGLHQKLLSPDVDPGLVEARIAGLVSTPLVFTLSIGVAAINPGAAMWVWLLALLADRPVSAILQRLERKRR